MKKLQLIVLFFWLNYTLLLASPPLESCSTDSSFVEGVCKCNPELCSKPPCLSTLILATNGSDIPGACCPTYTCENCSNETLIDGKCPCAVGAILNWRGICECVVPEMNLENGTCVCNKDLCPLPQICDDKSVSVSYDEGCCRKTNCTRCPDDSFPMNYNSDAVEDKCVCYPCETAECGVNQTAVIKRHGRNIPDHCCDLYDCVNISKSCIVDEIAYHEGETWETADKQICKCQNGISLCYKSTTDDILPVCHVDGTIYKHNESWLADTCTNCTCIEGEAKCIAHWCDVNVSQVKKIDCQPLVNCKKTCPSGFKVNKRGCEICKCNTIKYSEIFENYLLQKFNITVDELTIMLESNKQLSNISSTTSTTTTTNTQLPSTTIVSDKVSNYSDISNYWPYITVIVGLAVVIVVLVICRIQRKTASYDTAANMYEPIKLKQNNNIIKDTSSIKLYDKQ